MQKAWSILQGLVALVLLVVLTVVLVIVFRSVGSLQQPAVAAVPSATVCAPTPVFWVTSAAPNTATPEPGVYATVIAGPTFTPWPISKVTIVDP